MKNTFSILMIFATMAMVAQTEPAVPVMENENDSLSYFLGLSLGYELKDPPFEGDPDLILQGFTEAFKGMAPFDEQTCRTVFQGLQMSFQQKETETANMTALESQEKDKQYLVENGKRDGVITTESGLQYEILVKGDGPMPADTSEVEVHYEGTLTDGTVFDSSYDREESISFPLNRVIPGWTEGVQLMPVGSTYMFCIPSELAYGSQGSGPIPPSAVLIFKIELLGIK
jgi:FKBP-type peptidyl-prolyl cis-trans isomerase FkpA